MNKKVILLPEQGHDADAVLSELTAFKSGDVTWKAGRMFGYIYHPGGRESKAIEQAQSLCCHENALNPSLFPSLRKMENETVAIDNRENVDEIMIDVPDRLYSV
jgi:sphinganine-1-phosphate aldolase